MDPTVAIQRGQSRKRIDIGGLDLGILAILQDKSGDLVIVGQLAKNLCVGGIAATRLLAVRQTHYLEQDMGKLLGRIDVELLARKLPNARTQGIDLDLGFGAKIGKLALVDGHAAALHDGKRRNKRQVDIEEDACAAVVLKFLDEGLDQRQRNLSLKLCGFNTIF